MQDKKINVDEKDRWGYTALAWSCRRGEHHFTTKLLELGANPDLGGYGVDGNPPLHRAIVGAHVSCFFTLLDYGANIFLADSISKMNRTLLILISMGIYANDNVFCKPLPPSRMDASKNHSPHCNVSWIESILQAGLDINACDAQGMNALLWAVRMNNLHIADLLLRSGANYLQKNTFEYTILHVAAHFGSIDMLSVLKKHKLVGLRLDAELANGTTALDLVGARKDVSDQWIAVWDELVQGIIAADLELEGESRNGGLGEEGLEMDGNVGIIKGEEVLIIGDKHAYDDKEGEEGEDDDLVFHDANESIAQS